MAKRPALSAQPHLYIGDGAGRPLDNGTVYFGEPNKDPEYYPIDIFYDEDLTVPAAQPVRTKVGFLNVNGDMTEVYAVENEYSVKVLDQYGVTVYYAARTDRVIGAQGLQGEQGEKGDKGDSVSVIVANNAKTLNPPNIAMTEDGELRISDDDSNAATRKVGTLEGNLVERDSAGYPVNTNAIGDGQTWKNMTSSRSRNTTYTNETGRSIFISIVPFKSGSSQVLELLVGNVVVAQASSNDEDAQIKTISTIVPAGSTYRFNANFAHSVWAELR